MTTAELMTIPIDLIDGSPFQSREKLEPLESLRSVGLVIPLLVRRRGERYQLVAGHRRLASLKAEGKTDALCEVRDLSDEEAALALYAENHDRRDFSDYERGVYFGRMIAKFHLSERDLARRLHISHTTVSLCLAVAESRTRLVTPATSGGGDDGSGLYGRIVTTHKSSEVRKLPESQRTEALKEVVGEKMSTRETAVFVQKILGDEPIAEASASIVNAREGRKNERYHARKHRKEQKQAGMTPVICVACRGRLAVKHLGDSGRRHELISEGGAGEVPVPTQRSPAKQMVTRRVLKLGETSLVVGVPQRFARMLQLVKGSTVSVELGNDGKSLRVAKVGAEAGTDSRLLQGGDKNGQ